MKWRVPKIGETREIRKFAWLPIKANLQGSDEIRKKWLCFVFLHQRYVPHYWENEWFID